MATALMWKKLEEERRMLTEQKEKQATLLKAEVDKAMKHERKKIENAALESYEEKIKSLQEENEKHATSP